MNERKQLREERGPAPGALTRARGAACGKAILVGEHFVVWGGTALALPVHEAIQSVILEARPSKRNRVTLEDGSAGKLLAAARKGAGALLTEQRYSLVVSVAGNFPAGAGMGASAAFSVAFCRAVQKLQGVADEDLVAQVALDMEKVFHRHPSGIDSTTIAFETPCYVKTGPKFVGGGAGGPLAGFIEIRGGAVFLLADSGERADTGDVMERVRRTAEPPAGEKMVQRFTEVSESISLVTATELRKGNFEHVGTMMNENHHLLQALGVTTDRIDSLRKVAADAGALGAKLTGAGLGGFLLALCLPDNVSAVKDALAGAGVATFFVQPTDDL